MSNWEDFRTVLKDDAIAFAQIVTLMEAERDKTNLIAQRQQLEVGMIPFASLAEATKHYLEVMEQIETGTYVSPEDVDVNDGGTGK